MDELSQKVLGLINTRSDAHIPEEKFTYSDSLSQYIDIDFSEHQAKEHWKNICQTLDELENKLGKKVNLYLAIVDYFTGANKVINSPVLVEIKVLRETEEMAMQDSLTGAFNRRYMDIYLRKEINRFRSLSGSSSEHRFDSNQHLTQVKRLRDIIISSHSYNIYLCLNHILR